MYSEGNKDCSHLAGHHFPFFLENHGPVYDLHGSTVHEVSLGHHLEVVMNNGTIPHKPCIATLYYIIQCNMT